MVEDAGKAVVRAPGGWGVTRLLGLAESVFVPVAGTRRLINWGDRAIAESAPSAAL